MGEVLLIARAVLFAHLQRVKDVYLRARHVDFVGQRRNQVGIELVGAALPLHIGPRAAEHAHERADVLGILLHLLFRLSLQKLQTVAPVADEGIDHRKHQLRHQLRREGRGLVEVGAAEDAIIHGHAPARRHQSHEGTAQRAAVHGVDVPTEVFEDVVLDLLRFLGHGGKNRVLRLVEAVVADAEHAEIPLQTGNHRAEIALPVAAGAGQEHQRRPLRVAEGIDFHADPSASLR